jgi:hypothetical protein
MSRGWKGSQRRDELPADWPAIRERILERDERRCRWEMRSGRRCKADATDVDHIGAKHDHSDANLRSLCAFHHGLHTAAQAGEAATSRAQAGRRPPEQHPGQIMRRNGG